MAIRPDIERDQQRHGWGGDTEKREAQLRYEEAERDEQVENPIKYTTDDIVLTPQDYELLHAMQIGNPNQINQTR